LLSSAAEDRSRSIGRYEVLGELGHGGMAVVYRARDSQLLREVAVKVLHPHLSSDVESRRRFLREAQAAARLRHPNIVEVFDFSVEADRESFMVTELLEGPTLRQFAKDWLPLPAEVVAAIGVVLCDALACAHAQGVVHRDVKPDNILLHKGILKLTDFGIAHVADGDGMTVTGQILGSPAHMAPEQIEGKAVDARTDLFSLGTVLYWLAVGRLPFEAPVAHALLRKILEADYVDPVRAEPTVGAQFAAIIRRCMARLPEDRYSDAVALRTALCEFCAEVGWDDPAKKLTEYLAAPGAFTEAHKARLLQVLPERGRRARDEKRIPEAMAYFNRALAIDPTNEKVLELVRSVARRRQRERMLRGAALVTATAATSALLAVGTVKVLRSRRASMSPGTISQRSGSSMHATHEAGVNIARHTVHSAASISGTLRTDAGANEPNAHDSTVTALTSERTDAGTSTRSALRTEPRVRLVLRGMTGRVAIDGGEPLAFTGPFEHRLSVGTHQIQVLPNDPQCERPAPWRVNVRPTAVDSVQELVSPVFTCHSSHGSTGPRVTAAVNARSGVTVGSASTTTGNETVSVRLIVLGLQGLLSIDGRDPIEHDNGNEYLLSPGPHTVQVIPADPSCARPEPWHIEVTPTPEGTPLRLTSRRYACLPR
jgi:serine/threonine-protein kinase